MKELKIFRKFLNENHSDEDKKKYFRFLNNLRDSGQTNMFGAGSYLESYFGLSRKEAREILAKWMRSFDEPKDEIDRDRIFMKGRVDEDTKLNEFVGKELEDRNEPLYDKLVAGSGKSDTVQGEMLRAINRIVYRYYNDGDEYMRGYGTETAGPAHSFLVNANHPLKSLVSTLFSKGTNYEQTLKDVLDAILDHIESRQGKYTPNNVGDMFDYEPEFEDEESYEDDYDDDDYYDEDEY